MVYTTQLSHTSNCTESLIAPHLEQHLAAGNNAARQAVHAPRADGAGRVRRLVRLLDGQRGMCQTHAAGNKQQDTGTVGAPLSRTLLQSGVLQKSDQVTEPAICFKDASQPSVT